MKTLNAISIEFFKEFDHEYPCELIIDYTNNKENFYVKLYELYRSNYEELNNVCLLT